MVESNCPLNRLKLLPAVWAEGAAAGGVVFVCFAFACKDDARKLCSKQVRLSVALHGLSG